MKTMKSILTASLFVIFSIYLAQQAQAQSADVRQKNFNIKKKVAINGYDPVSYFQDQPQAGSQAHSYTHEGVTYHFANAENLATFKKNPEKYEPQYGGWCAYAIGAKGSKVPVNPETYKVEDGKLYLFYNKGGTNTLTLWNQDETSLKPKADQNWAKIVK